MQADREVMVRNLADFVCPENPDHTFEYVVDRQDEDDYLWLFAFCNQCPGEIPFWLVVPGNVAQELFAEDIREDLHWHEQIRAMMAEGVINDALAAIRRPVWIAMTVELARRMERGELRGLLEVPAQQTLLEWSGSLLDHLDREGMQRLLLLYAMEVGNG